MSYEERIVAIDKERAKVLAQEAKLPGILRSGAASRTRKMIMLREVASGVGAVVGPHTICGKGCSNCCHQHTLISELEAQVIADATGAPFVRAANRTKGLVGDVRTNAEADQRKYLSVPCTFLVDGACSIYEHRPMICRNHFSLADDAELCNPARGLAVRDLPLYHNEALAIVSAVLTLLTPQADIREFFPEGKG